MTDIPTNRHTDKAIYRGAPLQIKTLDNSDNSITYPDHIVGILRSINTGDIGYRPNGYLRPNGLRIALKWSFRVNTNKLYIHV